MADRADLNVFDQIQSLCRDYRRHLRVGNPERIENYLQKIDDAARQNLFQNLLHIDIEFRRRQQENPSSDEYVQRFPQFASSVRQAFFESTMMSGELDVTPDDDKTVQFAVPAARKIGEYELRRELGRGGFGVVYEALHRGRNELVALKTLPNDLAGNQKSTSDAERLHKFRNEFRALSEVNHPNLVGMQTLEMDGNQWFFTMDVVDGVDFLEYIRPNGQFDEQRLQQTLPQLVQGIIALHERRIVHRDLKPSNVLVESGGHVVILDFGLVAEFQQATDATVSLNSQHFVGTPMYAAPEQIAGTRDAASDWYALGVMLYEALTGKPPFGGSHVEVMLKKQSQDAPKFTGDIAQHELAGLIAQLLQREPQDRPNVYAIARAVGVTIETPSQDSADSRMGSLSGTTETILIGRETQLVELEDAWQTFLASREPIVVFVSGKSGEGKTSLVENFLVPLRLGTESLVLSGRCYDRESVPFKAIDCLIDSLVTFLRSRTSDEVHQLLPDDIHMLAHLFPVLRRVEAIADRSMQNIVGIDSRQIRYRAFSALRKLFSTIGQTTPLLLFIDDLQWGDADSAAALHEVLLPPTSPVVMLLGTYRSDEAGESPFLSHWWQFNSETDRKIDELAVAVSPLTEDQCIEFFATRLGRDVDTLRQQAKDLFEGTQGNPHFLDQLTEGFDSETGQFQAVPLDEIIARRLRRLPAEATALLDVIAIAGQAVQLDEASEVAEQTSQTFSTITRMRSERLVRLIGNSDQQLVDTYHDKIRETVQAQLSQKEQQAIHLKLAETIERNEKLDGSATLDELNSGLNPFQNNSRVFDLSYHFSSAGHAAKALVYATWAAESAKGQFALESALEQYDVARHSSNDASRALRYRIEAGYGETLTLAGQYDQAMQVLKDATELANKRFEIAKLEAAQAEITYKSKSVSESIAAYEEVLKRLRIWIPRSKLGLALSVLIDLSLGNLYSLFRRYWTPSNAAPDKETELTIRVLLLLTQSTSFRNPFQWMWSTLRAINHASPFRDFPVTAMCFALHGTGLMIFWGRYLWGERYYGRAQAILQRMSNLQAEVFVTRMHGYGLWAVAQYEAAMESLAHAHHILKTKVTDAWALTYVHYWMSCVQFRMGDLAESQIRAKEAFELAVRLGQSRIAQSAIEPWTRATGGNLPFEELKSRFQKVPDDFTSTIQMLTAESHWHLFHQRTSEAVDLAEQACELLKRHWLINVQTTSAISTLARALREHADSPQTDPHEADVLQSRALRAAKWSVRIARILPLEKPVAFRELSLAYAVKGRIKKALKYARKSRAVAEEQKARYESAQSLLLCGQLGEQLDRPEAKEQVKSAQTALVEFQRMTEPTGGGA